MSGAVVPRPRLKQQLHRLEADYLAEKQVEGTLQLGHLFLIRRQGTYYLCLLFHLPFFLSSILLALKNGDPSFSYSSL